MGLLSKTVGFFGVGVFLPKFSPRGLEFLSKPIAADIKPVKQGLI